MLVHRRVQLTCKVQARRRSRRVEAARSGVSSEPRDHVHCRQEVCPPAGLPAILQSGPIPHGPERTDFHPATWDASVNNILISNTQVAARTRIHPRHLQNLAGYIRLIAARASVAYPSPDGWRFRLVDVDVALHRFGTAAASRVAGRGNPSTLRSASHARHHRDRSHHHGAGRRRLRHGHPTEFAVRQCCKPRREELGAERRTRHAGRKAQQPVETGQCRRIMVPGGTTRRRQHPPREQRRQRRHRVQPLKHVTPRGSDLATQRRFGDRAVQHPRCARRVQQPGQPRLVGNPFAIGGPHHELRTGAASTLHRQHNQYSGVRRGGDGSGNNVRRRQRLARLVGNRQGIEPPRGKRTLPLDPVHRPERRLDRRAPARERSPPPRHAVARSAAAAPPAARPVPPSTGGRCAQFVPPPAGRAPRPPRRWQPARVADGAGRARHSARARTPRAPPDAASGAVRSPRATR